MKKIKYIAFILFIILVSIVLFYKPILRSFAQFLIVENKVDYVETAFVLSGGAFDRGNFAAQLLNTNKIGKAICTGENQSPDLKAYQQEILESELTQLVILSNTGDSSKVSLLKKGTSTFEESEAILAYCIANNIQNCAVISSAFHTRRIKYVFSDKFKAKGINVYIYGAPSSIYDEYAWWKSENGLIALNNEYIKYAYYLLK